MTIHRRFIVFRILSVFLALTALAAGVSTLDYPVEYRKLDNGLKVVLSVDKTAPIVTVAVYYKIGFRIEPRDRTGFAHLFEHMMFQGSDLRAPPASEHQGITEGRWPSAFFQMKKPVLSPSPSNMGGPHSAEASARA